MKGNQTFSRRKVKNTKTIIESLTVKIMLRDTLLSVHQAAVHRQGGHQKQLRKQTHYCAVLRDDDRSLRVKAPCSSLNVWFLNNETVLTIDTMVTVTHQKTVSLQEA